PEQVRGEPADFRCDVYSVGVILYELLTGKLPFVRAETMDVLFAHATEAPPTFADAGATGWVPGEVEHVVMRCLSKGPAERPGSARDLARDFHEALMLSQSGPLPPLDALPPAADSVQVAPAADTPLAQRTPVPPSYDPNAVTYRMEAWMPDAIASYKL